MSVSLLVSPALPLLAGFDHEGLPVQGSLAGGTLVSLLCPNRSAPLTLQAAFWTMALEFSAVLLGCRLDGTASLGQIPWDHHRMNLNACIQCQEPRLGNRWEGFFSLLRELSLLKKYLMNTIQLGVRG